MKKLVNGVELTNTNLQILEQTSTGVLDVDISAGSSTLVLTDGATSTGKNVYLTDLLWHFSS